MSSVTRTLLVEPGAAPIGLLSGVGRLLLLSALPLSIVWYPLTTVPGAGNLTGGDLALFGLWATTAAALLSGGVSRVSARAAWITAVSVLIGLLAGAGSELSYARHLGFVEFMEFMKRFGLASVVPVAAELFSDRSMSRRARVLSGTLLVAMAVFTVFPGLHDLLPSSSLSDPDELADGLGQRASGLVTNPNDLAYCAFGLIVLHSALLPRRPSVSARSLFLVSALSSAICIIGSGSRSGVIGSGVAIAYLLLSSSVRLRTKAAIIACIPAFVIAGLAHSSEFKARMDRAYRMGYREESMESRLDTQMVVAKASLQHPLGVGFRSFDRATAGAGARYTVTGSDSVYFDTLLGAGVLGLAGIVVVFLLGWRHVGSCTERGAAGTSNLRAGILAFALFGTATVVPVSIVCSTLFFSLMAAGSYLRRSEEGLLKPE